MGWRRWGGILCPGEGGGAVPFWFDTKTDWRAQDSGGAELCAQHGVDIRRGVAFADIAFGFAVDD